MANLKYLTMFYNNFQNGHIIQNATFQTRVKEFGLRVSFRISNYFLTFKLNLFGQYIKPNYSSLFRADI